MPPSGTRRVCPADSTNYTITAAGEGGSETASATVAVNAPPPPPPPPAPAPAAPKVVARLTIHVNFAFDKASIPRADTQELEKAVEFVKKYPGYKISIDGYTDSTGPAAYNQRLSERRAAAVKEYLLKHGVEDGERITAKGYGESNPIASNRTKQGRAQNRRAEILILSE